MRRLSEFIQKTLLCFPMTVVLAAVDATAIAQPPRFTARILAQYGSVTPGPQPSVTSTVPAALSDIGEVVGSNGILESEATGILFRQGGDLLFNEEFGFAGSEAAGINSSGAVVGAAIFDFATQFPQPYLYRPGVGLAFPPKPIQDEVSEGRAVDINEHDVIVGSVDALPGGPFEDRGLRGAVWKDGALTVLDTLGGEFSVLTRVNNNGQAIGRSPTELGGFAVSFLWTEATGLVQIPDPAGFEGLVASDLNDDGTFVGWMDRDLFDRFAFRLDAATGEMVPLDRGENDFVNQAHAINERGTIVGVGQRANEDRGYARLWFDGVGYDLNDLVDLTDFHLTEAVDINERGQVLILGFKEAQPGSQQGFSVVLTPVPEPAAAILAIVVMLATFPHLSSLLWNRR